MWYVNVSAICHFERMSPKNLEHANAFVFIFIVVFVFHSVNVSKNFLFEMDGVGKNLQFWEIEREFEWHTQDTRTVEFYILGDIENGIWHFLHEIYRFHITFNCIFAVIRAIISNDEQPAHEMNLYFAYFTWQFTYQVKMSAKTWHNINHL